MLLNGLEGMSQEFFFIPIAEAYGVVFRRVTGAPSAKTSYVVVGENAGPKKLQIIKDKGLKMVDEDGFLNLIATRKGVLDAATIAKMEKEQEKIRKDAKEMEMREKAAAKEAQKAGTAATKYVLEHPQFASDLNSETDTEYRVVDPRSQLWTQKYAPQNLKEICGNKGAVEKLNNWLAAWCVKSSIASKLEFEH